MKSKLALVFFSANLSLLGHANTDYGNLNIHIDPQTDRLIQQPATDTDTQQKKSIATRPLLSIKASPIAGGGFIVTPQTTLLPQMSINIDEDGQMHTICR